MFKKTSIEFIAASTEYLINCDTVCEKSVKENLKSKVLITDSEVKVIIEEVSVYSLEEIHTTYMIKGKTVKNLFYGVFYLIEDFICVVKKFENEEIETFGDSTTNTIRLHYETKQ